MIMIIYCINLNILILCAGFGVEFPIREGKTGRLCLFWTAGEILNHHPDGFFHRPSKNRLSLPFATDKVGVPEFLDVMGNRGQGDIKMAGHIADGRAQFLIQGCLSQSEANMLKNTQTRFIGQGLEGGDNTLQILC